MFYIFVKQFLMPIILNIFSILEITRLNLDLKIFQKSTIEYIDHNHHLSSNINSILKNSKS